VITWRIKGKTIRKTALCQLCTTAVPNDIGLHTSVLKDEVGLGLGLVIVRLFRFRIFVCFLV